MLLTTAKSYDEIPYPSLSVPVAQPDRLAAVARLRGLNPPAARGARVLELGCASGENLLPMADRDPEGFYLGIDFSARQIAMANELRTEAGLTNTEFRQQDITALPGDLGTFDYIIAHGVYSWVPPETRDKLMAILRDHLAPQGIAYVSYNTYPGWQVHDMLRAVMRYDSRRAISTGEQLSRARQALEFLRSSLTENEPYDKLVQTELEGLLQQGNPYLRHEHLEDVNQPVYFKHFMAHARQHKLQLVGDWVLGVRMLDYLGPEAEGHLDNLTSDPIQKEQFRDIARNRAIRQTLLTHEGLDVQRTPSMEWAKELFLAARLTRETAGSDSSPGSVAPPGSDPSPDAAERFTAPNGMRVSTGVPLIKAALTRLSESWPSYLKWNDLVSTAQAKVATADAPPAEAEQAELKRLEENLLQCCLAGVIEIHRSAAPFAAQAGERPAASGLARAQAHRGELVTNRRHEAVRLELFARHLLQLLDGSRTLPELVELTATMAGDGRLVVQQGSERITDVARARGIMGEAVPPTLKMLADHALLIA